jgi:hypothetical protein
MPLFRKIGNGERNEVIALAHGWKNGLFPEQDTLNGTKDSRSFLKGRL